MAAPELQQFNWADYIVLGIIGISTFISLIRGFVREAISLATWFIAFWVALKFSVPLSDVFSTHINSPSLRLVISFAVLFIATVIVGGIINYLISQLVDRTGLSGTDRMLGMLFGLARGVLLVGVIILLANVTALSKDPWWASSQLIPHFQGLAAWLNNFLPEQFSHLQSMVPNMVPNMATKMTAMEVLK